MTGRKCFQIRWMDPMGQSINLDLNGREVSFLGSEMHG